MADTTSLPSSDNASGTPGKSSSDESWMDLSDSAIPIIDSHGKKTVLNKAGFAAPAAPAAPAVSPAADGGQSPTGKILNAAADATKLAPPPPNLPTLEENPAPAPAAALPQPSISRADLGLDNSSDAADIKKIEEKPVVKSVDAELKKELPLLESMVQDAVSGTGVTLTGDDMRRRYSLLISLFFRGLRDGLETKSKFTMPVQSGGMGFDDATADRVIDELGTRNKAYKQTLTGKAADDKSEYVAKRTESILNLQENTDRDEQERGDKAFDGLMQRVGGRAEEPAAPPSMPRSIPVVGLDASPQQTPAAGTAIPVAAPPQSARMPQFGDSATRVTGNRPTVSDVAYAPKLTGPVEEIRQLTLKDFRRLSRDSKEAALKIKDKIDLLEEQSFEVKTMGINAWHDCEVNRMYLDILRQSLEGTPVVEVIDGMEKKSAQTLTKDEFDSVMQLNQKLRFG